MTLGTDFLKKCFTSTNKRKVLSHFFLKILQVFIWNLCPKKVREKTHFFQIMTIAYGMYIPRKRTEKVPFYIFLKFLFENL